MTTSGQGLFFLAGDVGGSKTSIGLFVAKNFAAATELANMLGNHSIFKSSYHEGTDQHLYACEVNKQFLLAVLFETKPGVVWFYAKQAVAALADLLDQATSSPDLPASSE